MKDITVLWKNYMELGKKADGGGFSEDSFRKQMNGFSHYLHAADRDYYYNDTFLQNYIKEFYHFLLCFYRKYPFVKRIFETLSPEKYQKICLVIDHYWMQEWIRSEEENKYVINRSVYPFCEIERVCDSSFFIECTVLYNARRFVYQSRINCEEEEIKKELLNLGRFMNVEIQYELNKEKTEE